MRRFYLVLCKKTQTEYRLQQKINDRGNQRSCAHSYANKLLQAVLLGGLLYVCTTEGDPVRNIDSSVQESSASIRNWVTFVLLQTKTTSRLHF
jgi:hypothetical protein